MTVAASKLLLRLLPEMLLPVLWVVQVLLVVVMNASRHILTCAAVHEVLAAITTAVADAADAAAAAIVVAAAGAAAPIVIIAAAAAIGNSVSGKSVQCRKWLSLRITKCDSKLQARGACRLLCHFFKLPEDFWCFQCLTDLPFKLFLDLLHPHWLKGVGGSCCSGWPGGAAVAFLVLPSCAWNMATDSFLSSWSVSGRRCRLLIACSFIQVNWSLRSWRLCCCC
jgi:hypothetical protein